MNATGAPATMINNLNRVVPQQPRSALNNNDSFYNAIPKNSNEESDYTDVSSLLNQASPKKGYDAMADVTAQMRTPRTATGGAAQVGSSLFGGDGEGSGYQTRLESVRPPRPTGMDVLLPPPPPAGSSRASGDLHDYQSTIMRPEKSATLGRPDSARRSATEQSGGALPSPVSMVPKPVARFVIPARKTNPPAVVEDSVDDYADIPDLSRPNAKPLQRPMPNRSGIVAQPTPTAYSTLKTVAPQSSPGGAGAPAPQQYPPQLSPPHPQAESMSAMSMSTLVPAPQQRSPVGGQYSAIPMMAQRGQPQQQQQQPSRLQMQASIVAPPPAAAAAPANNTGASHTRAIGMYQAIPSIPRRPPSAPAPNG
jgi:hypothetical protein